MTLKYQTADLNKKGKPKSSGKQVTKEKEFVFTRIEEYQECRDLVLEIIQGMKKLDL
jgi:hypothetical protein